MKLVVHRYGAIGDTLVLSSFLAPLRPVYDEIYLSGQQERLELIDFSLYDHALSWDSARSVVIEHARSADLSVAIASHAPEGFRVRFDPFPPDRTNIYDYMRSCALWCGGDPAATLDIPRAHKAGLLIHPGSGSSTKCVPSRTLFAAIPHSNHATVLLGPAESLQLDKLCSELGYLTARPTTLKELKTLTLSHAAFHGNDSGPAHLAALCGLDTTIHYQSSDPVIWKPPGRVTVVNHPPL